MNDRFVPYAYGDSKIRQNALCPGTANVGASKTFTRIADLRDNVAYELVSDFGFVDYDGGDYRIADDAKLYEKLPGFKPCDAANVGRRTAD